MHRLLFATAALVALSAAGGALAQTPPGPGGMLAAADANHDGTITRAEWDAARAARFAQLDANHDGSLSAGERPHWGGGGQGQPPAAGGDAEHHHGGMSSADTNGDGAISRAEYDAQSAGLFARLDTDHNGSISQAEMQAMHDHVGQH